MSLFGYARVSTEDQSLSLQIHNLEQVGCNEIITDHGFSGRSLSRPGLNKTLKLLSPGDVLVVWRLDRLGRSLIDLVQLLERLGQMDVGFRSLTESIDTASPGGLLVFHMMAALAQFERGLISERTRAGMAAARALGRHVGRYPSLTLEQCQEAYAEVNSGSATLTEVAQRYDVHPQTIRRAIERIYSAQKSTLGDSKNI